MDSDLRAASNGKRSGARPQQIDIRRRQAGEFDHRHECGNRQLVRWFGIDLVVGLRDAVEFGHVLEHVGNVLEHRNIRELGHELELGNLLELGHDIGGHDEPIMMSISSLKSLEVIERFACFGGNCAVLVQGSGPAGSAREAAGRFDFASELSHLNRDPRTSVPVSSMMLSFIEAAVDAASMTNGLVDPTLVGELERAGYATHFGGGSLPLSVALRLAPACEPAKPHPNASWRQVKVDRRSRTVTRPAGVRLDSGGIAKGLFGDMLAAELGGHECFAVEAAGDIRFGGKTGWIRPIRVASPSDGSILHTFELIAGAAATSGIGKRSWLDQNARPAHHLLDPASGTPAFTGVVQATALARCAVEAEALAKAALLSGPAGAAGWLPHGGVVVYENGEHDVIDPFTSEVTP